MIKEYDRIRLITDDYEKDGVNRGTKGIIVERYSTGDFEIQFEDINGNTTDIFFGVHADEVERID